MSNANDIVEVLDGAAQDYEDGTIEWILYNEALDEKMAECLPEDAMYCCVQGAVRRKVSLLNKDDSVADSALTSLGYHLNLRGIYETEEGKPMEYDMGSWNDDFCGGALHAAKVFRETADAVRKGDERDHSTTQN